MPSVNFGPSVATSNNLQAGLQAHISTGVTTFANLPPASRHGPEGTNYQTAWTSDQGLVYSNGTAWVGLATASNTPFNPSAAGLPAGVGANVQGLADFTFAQLPAAVRQAATRCFPPMITNGSFTRGMSCSTHYARQALVNPTVVYGNFQLVTASEVAGATGSIKVGIEYPIGGTVTLSNENIAAGGLVAFPAGLVTLTFAVTIPKGALFRMRVYQVMPSGIRWTTVGGGSTNGYMYDYPSTDGMDIGTTDNDKVLTGSIGASNGINYFPLVIATMTTQPGVMINGDSRECGGDSTLIDNTMDLGITSRAVGRTFGYLNFGQAATLLSQWNAGTHTNYNALLAAGYFTHIINAQGVNDAGNGSSGATIATARATFAAAVKAVLPTVKVIGTTIFPYVTSSDAFITKANQTKGVNQGRLDAFNILERIGIAGEDFVWDCADAVDPFREGLYPIGRDPSATSRTAASFTGSVSGTTFTVTAVGAGAVYYGMPLYDAGGNLAHSTYVTAFGTGTGGTGTYTVSHNHDGVFPNKAPVTSTTITDAAFFTRDGLHLQGYGEEIAVRNSAPFLISILLPRL